MLKPSSCQRLFDADTSRPRVKKCTIIACPIRTVSRFSDGFTQPHWAHQSEAFLELPAEWAHLEWVHWWRALTQYLIQPSGPLLAGLSSTLERVTLYASSGPSGSYLHRPPPGSGAQAMLREGFAERFAAGVASWSEVRRGKGRRVGG